MNKDVIVVVQKEENIKKLKTIFDLAGYNLFIVHDINLAIIMMNKFIPLAIVIVEENKEASPNYPLEIKRVYPLVPLILLMEDKDHTKREEYLKHGYNFVIEFPWTEIELGGVLNSIEIKKIKNTKNNYNILTKISRNTLKIIIILMLFLIVLISISFINIEKAYNNSKPNITDIKVPSTSISGFFKKEDYLYIYDWIIQSFYLINYKTGKLETLKNFFTPYIITTIKDSGENFFFAITDEKEIKKFLKDGKYTLLSSIPYKNIKDICFDGMYIWILEYEYLTKALNNDTMTTIEKFNLNKEINQANYITCNQKNISYYTDTKIMIAAQENPTYIINSITLNYIISSVNNIDGKIIITSPTKTDTTIREIK